MGRVGQSTTVYSLSTHIDWADQAFRDICVQLIAPQAPGPPCVSDGDHAPRGGRPSNSGHYHSIAAFQRAEYEAWSRTGENATIQDLCNEMGLDPSTRRRYRRKAEAMGFPVPWPPQPPDSRQPL